MSWFVVHRKGGGLQEERTSEVRTETHISTMTCSNAVTLEGTDLALSN